MTDEDIQLQQRQRDEALDRQAYEEAEYDDMIERESEMEFESCFAFTSKCGVEATNFYLREWLYWFEGRGIPAAIVQVSDKKPHKFQVWRTGTRRHETEIGNIVYQTDGFKGTIVEECHGFGAKVGATMIGGKNGTTILE